MLRIAQENAVLDWVERTAGNVSDVVNGTLGPAADFLEEYVWKWPEQAPLLAARVLLQPDPDSDETLIEAFGQLRTKLARALEADRGTRPDAALVFLAAVADCNPTDSRHSQHYDDQDD